ncbi:hypothetical protein OROMI_004232 [Orobanche minor]
MGGGLDGNFSHSELNEYEEKPYDEIHLNISNPDRVHIVGKTHQKYVTTDNAEPPFDNNPNSSIATSRLPTSR